jgi:Gnt-I system low-affinity gluconate transporter
VLILTPLLLIVARTVSDMLGKGMDAAALERTAAVRMVVGLLGEPVIALLITTLLCFRLLGTSRGYTREQVQEIATRSLEPAGIILLVTGAGGVLKQVLVDSKVGEVVAGGLIGSGAPVVLMAFVLAAAVRVMQGSATVAMMTAGGLTASLLAEGSLSAPRLALLSVAIASGATIASHVNDSGFWLVNRFFGLTVADTLRSWTMVTTLVSLIGLAMVLLMWQIVE